LDFERIFHTGTFAPAVKKGACREGMAAHQIFMGDKSDVTAALLEFIRPGDWILVKGSRGAKMEEIVCRLEAFDEPAV
jgi:UDP-N-acetylmuramoyl-tripeptide--D-alanyl-D-alanine ligase